MSRLFLWGKDNIIDEEKTLEKLRAELKRLWYWTFVPYAFLAIFVISTNSPVVRQLIAPLSVPIAVIIFCGIDMVIVIPIAMKMDKIYKHIKKLTENHPP